jgi:hypothetical protein
MESESTFFSIDCPYCGESVELSADALGVSTEDYVEDCPVCCRPWMVHLTRSGDGPSVEIHRDDD